MSWRRKQRRKTRMRVRISFLTPLEVQVEPVAEVKGIWTLTFSNGIRIRGENMSSTLPSGGSAMAQVSWVDAAGNPAPVDGATGWVSSDSTIVTVTVNAADSTMATVTAPGPIGPAQVQATADADMGSGVQTITAVLDLSVIAGQAVGGVITLS